jgi:hypothetical protein
MRTLNRHITEGQVKKARDALPKGIRALWPEPEQTARGAMTAPRAEEPAPGAPSRKQSATGDAVERQPEHTGVATGTPMAQSAPAVPSAEPATAKAAERAMSDQGGSNRAGAKMRTRRKGKLPAEP